MPDVPLELIAGGVTGTLSILYIEMHYSRLVEALVDMARLSILYLRCSLLCRGTGVF